MSAKYYHFDVVLEQIGDTWIVKIDNEVFNFSWVNRKSSDTDACMEVAIAIERCITD